MRQSPKRDQNGFALPVIILLMGLMAIVAYSVLSQSSNNLTLTYRQAYLQMARVASKAAIDYAQEQFDNSSCGNYSGTPETTLVTNTHYRLTFQASVVSTSSDGLSKTIEGIGRVYLPQSSTNALYVFSIDSEIVNTFATCKTPANYAPLIWLDASNTSSLLTQVTGTDHPATSGGGLIGGLLNPSGDTVEELAANGSQTLLSWEDSNMQMSSCSLADFSSLTCLLAANKYLYDGVVFPDVAIPQGATITSATLQLVNGASTGNNSSETNQVNGIYQSSTNPYTPLFSEFGTSQLKTPLTTSGLHTSNSTQFTTSSVTPGGTINVNVQSIVQEMVNKSTWNSTINDGKSDFDNMGFGIQYVSGSGSRSLAKNGMTLDITWSGSGTAASSNGSSIIQWNDQSGNGNNAVFTYGTAPTRIDNQINGKTVLSFNNGAMLSNLTTALSGQRELTVFAVVKPSFSTSNTNGRFVSGTSSTATNDTTSGSSIIPLMRDGSSSGFSSIYSGSSSAYQLSDICGSCNSTPDLFGSIFQINNSTSVNSYLRYDGGQVAEADSLSPSGSPYTFGLNEFYFGGTRSGALPGSGTDYMNGQYAEIIVYNHALSCYEAESIENYLNTKWDLSAGQYPDTCPAPTIPTL